MNVTPSGLCRTAFLLLGTISLTCHTHADGIRGVLFVDGSVLINGSANSPAGPASATAPGTVTPTTVTGGGSTGSGLVSGVIDFDGGIVSGSHETFIHLTGFAQASQPAGYSGFATINVSFATLDFSSDPLVFTLPQTAFYKVWNTGQQTVSLSAVSGSVGATTLSPGTYKLSMNFGATVSAPQTLVEKTLDWTLRLSTEPLSNLPADLNLDGTVTAADLAMLLAAWGTPLADLNGNGSTAAEDLAILLAAWD
ncbi:MAG: hypothetical protein JNL80_09370 [Phycisphaerae bacterium]|nr:hypothetical protein [Phycisphaerae bacterium]